MCDNCQRLAEVCDGLRFRLKKSHEREDQLVECLESMIHECRRVQPDWYRTERRQREVDNVKRKQDGVF